MRIQLASICMLFVFLANSVWAGDADKQHQFTYAWPYFKDDLLKPRGGITRGPDVKLDAEISNAWIALQTAGTDKKAKDRLAILAMAGGYRVSFDFIETIGFVPDFQPDKPYQSWATEYVYVVTDEPDFVSLQHIIVMFFETGEGKIEGPIVIKHWRQDWQYQDRDLHLYVGFNTWQKKSFTAQEVAGTWSQAVYQVDDSPRYQAIGFWQHHGNYSSWESENTWRPLPRREFSVRDDYQVLSGTNRHTITPQGWVQEEDNLKLKLDAKGSPASESPYLAREAGLIRYERIVEQDFSAGHRYWSNTGLFWKDVRAAWTETFKQRNSITLASKVDGQSLFQVMFGYAGSLDDGKEYDPEMSRKFIARTLDSFIE
ncbi:MAG: DUF6607 family protein [Pseudomonadota bacterium]